MSKIHIWPEEITEVADEITISITIEDSQQIRTSLWYRLPSKYKSMVTHSCDPFVVATIMMAMNQSSDLVVHGEVSPSLLRNLTEFQAVWHCWRPQSYSLVNIIADIEQEQVNYQSSAQAISAFSGGVDSCFTIFRHCTGRCGRLQRPLKAGLMVHGFDIPLKKQQIFDSAAQKSRLMLSSLGVELITLATNFRQVIKVRWEDAFATAIASSLLLLQNGFREALIPSSPAYNALSLPYGSNPITDNLLCSDNFKIIHDGAAFSRIEKTREIANWPEALQCLRVCWEGDQADRNCCRCEKCVRNILNFRILGLGLPPCFEQDITDNQILTIKVKGRQLEILEQSVKNAKSAGISESWVRATELCIWYNRIRNTINDSLPISIKQQLHKIKS